MLHLSLLAFLEIGLAIMDKILVGSLLLLIFLYCAPPFEFLFFMFSYDNHCVALRFDSGLINFKTIKVLHLQGLT